MVKNTYTFLFLETVVVEPAPKKVISSAKPNNVARASITSNMHQFNSVSSVPTVYTAVSTDANIETLIRANDIIRVDYLKKQDAFVEQKRGLEDRIKHLSEQKLAVEKKHRDQINAMKEKHQHLMMTKQSEFETKLTKMEQAYNAMENRYKRDAQARDENFAVQLDQTRSDVMAAMQAEKNGLIQQINDLTEAINAGEADKKQRIDNLVKANEKTIAKCKGVMAERDRYAKLFKENKENCSTITEAEKKHTLITSVLWKKQSKCKKNNCSKNSNKSHLWQKKSEAQSIWKHINASNVNGTVTCSWHKRKSKVMIWWPQSKQRRK